MIIDYLADSLVILHLIFIGFVVFGGLLALKWKPCIWFHLPAVFWAVGLELMDWGCPLTPLENWLRRQTGGPTYESGFIEHYLLPLLYPAGLTRDLQIVLGMGVIVINLIIYGYLWRRRKRERKNNAKSRVEASMKVI